MPHYGIGFAGAIARGFKKYSVFTGRASRSEFWWWYLFINLVTFVLGFVGIFTTSRAGDGTLGNLLLIIGLVSIILLMVFALGTIVPSLALGGRRLHDAGYSGLFMLLVLIPYL